MPRAFWIVLAIFGVLNLFVLNIFVSRLWFQPENVPTPTPVTTASDSCGESCQQYINTVVKTALAKLTPPPATIIAPTIQKMATTTPEKKAKTRHVSYLPISVSGSTKSNDWADLPGTEFYFDTADYPGLVSIYFEANIRLFNGNGTAFVRLYDTNHGIGVQGSDAQSSSQSDTAVVSGQVSIYSGKNLIRVQAKSLTADTAIFNSGRLKIITEN